MMSESRRDVMVRLRAADNDRRYLLAVLDLWEQVQGQGINPESVASFGFSPSMATAEQRRKAKQWPSFYDALGVKTVRPLLYNFVLHHGGGTTKLDPQLIAVFREE